MVVARFVMFGLVLGGPLLSGVALAACCPLARLYMVEPPEVSGCPSHKIGFTQETGCLNDGSVEFCLPAGDPAALAAVLDILPQTTCIQARGRAGCDLETQLLCRVDTAGMCRADRPQAMTDPGWQTVCQLASLPFVPHIVPT